MVFKYVFIGKGFIAFTVVLPVLTGLTGIWLTTFLKEYWKTDEISRS